MTPVKLPTADNSDNGIKKDIQNILASKQNIYNELNELFGEKSFTLTENNSVNPQSKHKMKFKYFYRIKNFYRNNDLFKYAVWAAGLLFTSTLILTIIEWETFYSSVSEHLEKDKPTMVDTIFNTFWWSVVTFTTVGYGDVSPVTHSGKGLSIIIMLLNFGVVTLLGGAVASVLVAARLKGDKKLDETKFNDHLIIAGWNSFIRSTLKLIEDDLDSNPVIILINETDQELISRSISGFDRLEITHLSENYTKETVLKKAFIEKCNTFMIVPDESALLPNETPDEDKTVLTALTANSISDNIQVVAQILNSDYISHLNRANVSEIVFTDAHIPYLLAKHVTDPGIPQLYDELIHQRKEGIGLEIYKIPNDLLEFTHNKISAYFKLKYNSLLIGYAIRKSGFNLEEEMSGKGDSFIRNMITDQLEGAGIKLSSDEHIAVNLNPSDDYQIDQKHTAILLR